MGSADVDAGEEGEEHADSVVCVLAEADEIGVCISCCRGLGEEGSLGFGCEVHAQ